MEKIPFYGELKAPCLSAYEIKKVNPAEFSQAVKGNFLWVETLLTIQDAKEPHHVKGHGPFCKI